MSENENNQVEELDVNHLMRCEKRKIRGVTKKWKKSI